MKSEEQQHNMYMFLIAVVAIVAVVGVIGLVSNSGVGSAFKTLSTKQTLEAEALPGPEPVSRCTDSDGENAWFTPGWASDSNGREYDYCTGDVVTDWYCTSALPVARVTGALQEYKREKSKDCKSYGDAYGCAVANGAYCSYCLDTDPSDDIYTWGLVNLTNSSTQQTYQDYCSGNYMHKYYCTPDHGMAYDMVYNCPNGCTDDNKRCKAPKPEVADNYVYYNQYNDEIQMRCIGYDGNVGLYSVNGDLVKYDPIYDYWTIVDWIYNTNCNGDAYCTAESTYENPEEGLYKLGCYATNTDFVASDNTTNTTVVNQSNQSVTCTDTDGGGKLYLFGSTYGWDHTNGDFYEHDTCLSDYMIEEHWCVSSGLHTQTFDCRNYGYDLCVNGECVQSNQQTCFDSDPENDPYVFGFVNATNMSNPIYLPDFCVGQAVGQYYCDGDEVNWYGYYNCPNDCSNGACIGNISKPDLVVLWANYSTNINGSLRGIRIKVKNIGNANAGYSYVFSNINVTNMSIPGSNVYVPPLSYVQGQNEVEVYHFISEVLPLGYQTYYAYADATYRVDEANENNNVYATNYLWTYP